MSFETMGNRAVRGVASVAAGIRATRALHTIRNGGKAARPMDTKEQTAYVSEQVGRAGFAFTTFTSGSGGYFDVASSNGDTAPVTCLLFKQEPSARRLYDYHHSTGSGTTLASGYGANSAAVVNLAHRFSVLSAFGALPEPVRVILCPPGRMSEDFARADDTAFQGPNLFAWIALHTKEAVGWYGLGREAVAVVGEHRVSVFGADDPMRLEFASTLANVIGADVKIQEVPDRPGDHYRVRGAKELRITTTDGDLWHRIGEEFQASAAYHPEIQAMWGSTPAPDGVSAMCEPVGPPFDNTARPAVSLAWLHAFGRVPELVDESMSGTDLAQYTITADRKGVVVWVGSASRAALRMERAARPMLGDPGPEMGRGAPEAMAAAAVVVAMETHHGRTLI